MLKYTKKEGFMIKEMCNIIIYNDFIDKVILSDDEKQILDLLIKKKSIVQISQELNISDSTVSRIIKDLKEKYKNYKAIEIAKYDIFKTEN
jgi:DNA-directed RNA polymerase specialized sigma subunit